MVLSDQQGSTRIAVDLTNVVVYSSGNLQLYTLPLSIDTIEKTLHPTTDSCAETPHAWWAMALSKLHKITYVDELLNQQ